MTAIRDLLEQRYRELLTAAFTAAPNPLPDLVDDQGGPATVEEKEAT